AKVRITGHQCSLVFDGQGRSKAVDTVELVLGLDLGGTERSLGCGVHQADGQCMHSAHGCDRSVQPMSAKDSAIDLSVVHRCHQNIGTPAQRFLQKFVHFVGGCSLLKESKQCACIEHIRLHGSRLPSWRCSSRHFSSKSGPSARQPITRSMYASVMGCRTMRPNWSSRNLTLVTAAIPCLRRSSAGTTSWPFEVNVALASFMTYILPQVRHTLLGGRRHSGNSGTSRQSRTASKTARCGAPDRFRDHSPSQPTLLSISLTPRSSRNI